MAYIGRFNRLTVTKLVDHGVYLDAVWLGEVLLPNRDVPENCQVGDKIGVFIYLDSEDRLIATTKRPLAQAGEVACLNVIQVNRVGAFMDWGLPKDLLVPFNQQQPTMEEGKSYLVYVHVDEETNRIIASSLLNKFISKDVPEYQSGQAVELHVSEKTDLGYACVIDHQYWGLLFYSDVVKPLKIGQHIKGFIKRIRDDGKVDLSLQAPGFAKVDDLTRRVLRALNENNGFLGLSDKSPPEAIYEKFGTSKKSYKMTIGNMLKKKLISIEKDGIRLLKDAE
jgi:predicted RNA-binding protein (virulence factor B family)